MTTAKKAETTADQLVKRICAEYESLSRQLKLIALHIEKDRDHVGLERVRDVAQHCGVQPSTVVRFAKHFGFSGFSELQAIFRKDISRQLAPNRNYRARIQNLISSGPGKLSNVEIAREFLIGSAADMHDLVENLDIAGFKTAVDLLAASDCIWVAASRRSFPIASYLDYALQHTDKRIGLISAFGSTHLGQVRSVRKGDVMIATSFAPYAAETFDVAKAATERGANLVAITDSQMSPLAGLANVSLIVQENAALGFRSLCSTMGLAQSLFIALAYTLEFPVQQTT